jgi:hypothetical protein
MKQSALDYTLVDSGKTRGGLDFQRYKAVGDEKQSVSVQQWTQMLASDGSLSDSFSRVLQVRVCHCVNRSLKNAMLWWLTLVYLIGRSVQGILFRNQGSYKCQQPEGL